MAKPQIVGHRLELSLSSMSVARTDSHQEALMMLVLR